jgi:hypothetical protein
MQFDYNSDYATLPPTPPLDFPPADPYPCARITTRIYHPSRDEISTVQNVLVRTMMPKRSSTVAANNNNASLDSMDDSSSSSDESFMTADDDDDVDLQPQQQQQQQQQKGGESNNNNEEERAYWMQRTIREAIYGRVLYAVVLKKKRVREAEWVVTEEQCAVKEMSWQHIRKERDRLAEDPIKEVSSMQFLKRWHDSKSSTNATTVNYGDEVVRDSFTAMSETNIMMPMDLLSDDRHLYSVMPFCDGGELFERLDMEEKFPEPEARYWMVQVLNVRTYMLLIRECLFTCMNVSCLTNASPLESPNKSGLGKSSKCWYLSS